MRARNTLCSLLVIFFLLVSTRTSAVLMFPFSKIINWHDDDAVKRYDAILRASGITIEQKPLARRDAGEKLAKEEFCILLFRGSVMVGKGVILRDVFSRGGIVKGVEFELTTIEVITDNEGGSALLVTYRALLSPWQRFQATMRGYRTSGDRAIVSSDNLGGEVWLDEKSQKLRRAIMVLPYRC